MLPAEVRPSTMRRVRTAAFAVSALVAAALSGFLAPTIRVRMTWDFSVARRADLRVATYNVGNAADPTPTGSQVVAALEEFGSLDVVLLQEEEGGERAAFVAEALGLPFRISTSTDQESVSRLAVLSRYPLTYISPSGEAHRRHLLAARVRTPSGDAIVATIHLPFIHKTRDVDGWVSMGFLETLRIFVGEVLATTTRSAAVRELLPLTNGEELPVIVGGDFNTISVSRTIREVRRSYTDSLWNSTAYHRGTYRLIRFPVKPRVDYIFHSGVIYAHSGAVGSGGFGDHHPVVASFEFPPFSRSTE